MKESLYIAEAAICADSLFFIRQTKVRESGMTEYFMNNTIDCFLECCWQKKLILFGAGDEMARALPLFVERYGLIPAYCVDNDFRKWYGDIFGIKVFEPQLLRTEDANNTVVLITSVYPYRIAQQIQTMGIKNYFSSVLFLEDKIEKVFFNLKF